MTTTNTTTLPVTFIKQGGLGTTGTAIGRKGKALLIVYHIQDGDRRERWIPANRVIELAGDIDTLPRWKSASCPGVKWAEPMTEEAANAAGLYVGGYRNQTRPCPKCGGTHRLIGGERHRRAVVDTEATESLPCPWGTSRVEERTVPGGELIYTDVRSGERWVYMASTYTGTASLKLADVLVG